MQSQTSILFSNLILFLNSVAASQPHRQGNQPTHLAFVVVSNNYILIKSILNWLYEFKILKKVVFWNVLKWGSKCHVTFAL